MYDFDRLLNRYGTNSVKWEDMAKTYGTNDLLPMFVADMDFACLPEISEALVKRASHPTYGYTFASPEFYSSYIAWNKNHHNFDLQKEEIMPIGGVVCATSFAISALTEKGDRILLHTPAYFPFFSVISDLGRVVVPTTMVKDANGQYETDWVDFENKIKDVKMFILCSPHNPTGRVWSRKELTRIVDLCYKYGVKILSDEIHSDLVFDGKHIVLPSLNEKAKEITVLTTAPSKTFNIAGMKSSFIIIQNPELRQKVSTLMGAFHMGIDLFAYTATEAAYTYGEKWVEELCEYLKKNAEFVVDFCATNLPKVKVFMPQATYLMWLDFSAYGLSQEDLFEKCKEAKVAMNNGIIFGRENREGEGFMRLNIGTPKARVEQALNQLKETFDKL